MAFFSFVLDDFSLQYLTKGVPIPPPEGSEGGEMDRHAQEAGVFSLARPGSKGCAN